MLGDDRLLVLLDRRAALVRDALSLHALAEAIRFLDWIDGHAVLRAHVAAIEADWCIRHDAAIAAYDAMVERARSLRAPLLEVLPEWHVDRAYDEDDDATDGRLCHFDALLAAPLPEILPEPLAKAGRDRRRERAERIVGVLCRAVREFAPKSDRARRDSMAAVREAIFALDRELKFAIGKFENWLATSPGEGLAELRRIHRRVVPRPDRLAEQMVSHQETQAQIEKRVDGPVRVLTHRLATEIHASISSGLSHRELVRRFKSRAEWFDRDRLVSLLEEKERESAKKQKIGRRAPHVEREAPLVLDLARYLFDNGVDALVEPRFGGLRVDLLAPMPRPLLVEGKAYRGADGRKKVLEAFAQTVGYASMLSGTSHAVDEAHLVVFRLAGRRFELPTRHEHSSGLTIFPLLVDLAPPDERGSRTKHVETITEGDIRTALDAREPRMRRRKATRGTRRGEGGRRDGSN